MSRKKNLSDVVDGEHEEINQRRRQAGLRESGSGGDLVGLCLSGGGLRSASFSLGFVQALQRIGIWRYIDYMSTVSGGGYIGAYISSAVLKRKSGVSKSDPLFSVENDEPQNERVKRFIYGGQYLLKPLTLSNMYFMGLFFINLAIFSGVLAVCSLIAFSWRSLDYPFARRGLSMLGLGGDLVAPFVPFFVFAAAWFLSWCVSLFRRGGDATGSTAKVLFVATFISLLVALALLLGNGDIGGWQSSKTGENVSFGGAFWGPIIGLVLGGLLPFLSPKRLLESGLNPQHDWERYVFKIATTALLVGLPMVLVGWLAHENISGFNTNRYRPIVAGDIQDWPSLTSIVASSGTLDGSGEGETEQAKPDANSNVPSDPSDSMPELDGERSKDDGQEPGGGGQRSDDQPQMAQESAFVAALRDSAKTFDMTYLRVEKAVRDLELAETGGDGSRDTEVTATKEVDTKHDPTVVEKLKDLPPRFFDSLRGADLDDMTELERAKIDSYLVPYLVFASGRLSETQVAFDVAQGKFLGRGEWSSRGITDYLNRLIEIVLSSRGTGSAHAYWETSKKLQSEKEDFALVLDQVLKQPAFLESYLEARKHRLLLEGVDPDEERTLHALLTRAYIEDEPDVNVGLGTRQNAKNELAKWASHECHHLSRLTLEHDLPTIFRERSEIRRAVTIFADQKTRLKWFFVSLATFLIAGLWVDLNSLSLHRYYRDRIKQTFVVARTAKSPSVALSELVTTEYGEPYHLINGSVGLIRRGAGEEEEFFSEDNENVNEYRWVDSFLFSRLYCGSQITGYVDTVALEHSVRGHTHRMDLAEATAISGAALSPGHVQNWLLGFLMVALNLTLGQWIPNPSAEKPRSRPRVLTLLSSFFKKSRDRPYCFVTDGGHSENLGLVQLIRRRCRLIICVDAGCDPKGEFRDLGRAMRDARVHGGVRILSMERDDDGRDQELSLNEVVHRKDSGFAESHFVMGRIVYRDGAEGLLLYFKPSLTGDESADLLQYRKQSKTFPHEPTSDQLFEAAQVEAYRSLGYHMGMEIQTLLPRELSPGELWEFGEDVDSNRVVDWIRTKGQHDGGSPPLAACPNPLTASSGELDEMRPVGEKLISCMMDRHESAADIDTTSVLEVLKHEPAFSGVRPITAVAALQSAILDRQHRKATEREYGIWLLRCIKEDDRFPVNTRETLEVLVEAITPQNPEKVRMAAIEVCSILGRTSDLRDYVVESLTPYTKDNKPSIRLAVKNALSNLASSPRKPK